MLRLYLAHEPPLSECPYLDIARERNPAAFKSKVEERFLKDLDQEEQRRRVRVVFYGTNNRSIFRETPPDEAWDGGPDNIEHFLNYYADAFLDADLYNAAKHGLAIQPGEVDMKMADHEGAEILRAKGRTVQYLAEREEDDGARTWTRATQWIDLELNVGFILMATRLMEGIWDIARGRYCNQLPEAGINFFYRQPLFDEMFIGMEDIKVTTMHMSLLYYADQPPEGPPSGSGV